MYELEDIEHEYGLATDYNESFEDSGVAFSQVLAEGDLEDIDELIEQYENSSPSPLQRRGVVDSRPAYGFPQRFSHNPRLQTSYNRDEITDFDDREATGRLLPHFQASAHVAGPSNYRTPSFDRRSYGTQSGKDGPIATVTPVFYVCL